MTTQELLPTAKIGLNCVFSESVYIKWKKSKLNYDIKVTK